MKLPITDQFLLRVFNFIQKIDRSYDLFAPRSMKAALCPELFKLRREIGRKNDWKKFSQLVYYLKQKGFITIKNLENKQGVMLTQKGAQKVLRIKQKIEPKQQRKDGKWQMVIFDIPEKQRALREILRGALYAIGYQRLQDSVWVCPYDVERETESVVREYGIDPFVKVFLIEEVEV